MFVTADGRVKILDFGLAKLTQQDGGASPRELPTDAGGTEPGMVIGTVGYMSPEQVRGRRRSSLGHLRVRRGPLRDARRPARLPARDERGDDDRDPERRAARSFRHEPERLAPPRTHRPALPREETRAAISLRATTSRSISKLCRRPREPRCRRRLSEHGVSDGCPSEQPSPPSRSPRRRISSAAARPTRRRCRSSS